MDARGFADFIRHGAEANLKGFTEPDDDWVPVAFVLGDGDLVAMTPGSLEGTREKDLFAQMVTEKAIEMKADAIGFIVSAWIADIDRRDPKAAEILERISEVGVSGLPPEFRREILAISTATRLGRIDLMATIYRHDGAPPTLGEWKAQENTEGFNRFMDVALTALFPQG